MSRLSELTPILSQKSRECSVPVGKEKLPEKLTYLDDFMDSVCPQFECKDCPFYYVIPAHEKLTP